MSGEGQDPTEPSWELGDYVIRPKAIEAEQQPTVPWRRIALLVLLGLMVAGLAFVVVIAA